MYVWVLLFLPTCVDVECPRLSPPANGYVSGTGLSLGSSIQYFCNHGYQIEGTAFQECQEDGQWSAAMPTCQRKCNNSKEIIKVAPRCPCGLLNCKWGLSKEKTAEAFPDQTPLAVKKTKRTSGDNLSSITAWYKLYVINKIKNN